MAMQPIASISGATDPTACRSVTGVREEDAVAALERAAINQQGPLFPNFAKLAHARARAPGAARSRDASA